LHPQRVEDIAEIVRDTCDGLRIRAAGTWMHAGLPVDAAQELHLEAFAGVREYTPGDLTISVGAATTLSELEAVTRARGQWCPLLPWGDDRGTVGATLATATAGPFAAALGRPRDHVLGIECVDGLGRIVRAGGRVVKNVAGFDLTRLMVGSWGTLGIITEVHLRLRARPAVDLTLLVDAASADALHDLARSAPAVLAALPLGEAMTRALGQGHGYGDGHGDGRGDGHGDGHIPRSTPSAAAPWLLRLGGNAAQVEALRTTLAQLGACRELGADAWDIVRREMAAPDHTPHWPWTPLMRRIRERFDPRGVLNPGLLGKAA
jgi:FAD/FMN-containing dehydrogenase